MVAPGSLPRLHATNRARSITGYRDRSPELVNDHDFRSDAEGLAIPYGIYDTRANAGTVFVGQTADTPAFAVDCIEKWWRTEGCKHYPEANALQILADGGGSNSCTARAWKFNLQHRPSFRPGGDHLMRARILLAALAAAILVAVAAPAEAQLINDRRSGNPVGVNCQGSNQIDCGSGAARQCHLCQRSG